MKKAEVLDHFRVRRIDLQCKYLWIDVVILKRAEDIEFGIHPTDRYKNVTGQFRHNFDVVKDRGHLGQIRLYPCRKLEEIAMHESIHAAFEVSRKYRWKFDEVDREEFIAQTADYIYSQIRKRLRLKNYYRFTKSP